MEDFVLTALASFLGTLAALFAMNLLGNGRASPGLPSSPAERTPQHRRALLAATAAFAAVFAGLVYLTSAGDMAPPLALIAAVTTLFILMFAVRAVR